MSFHFARILERELQAVGLTARDLPHSAVESPRLARPTGRDAPPVPPLFEDDTAFSARSLTLSRSLREYAGDAFRPVRPVRADARIVTGWNEAGYLHDAGEGLDGEIQFTTASGTLVSIRAAKERHSREVRVTAMKDGREYGFSLADFAECRREEPFVPPRTPVHALEGRRCEMPAEATSYSPRTVKKR